MAWRLATLIVFVVLGTLAGLFGTGTLLERFAGDSADARRQEDESGAQRETVVEVASSRPKTIRDTVEAVGTVRAVRAIEVRPLTGGRVQDVAFEPGTRVEEGDLLVQLDDRAARAALKEAEATLTEAQNNFNRAEQLSEREFSTRSALEAARAEMQRAEAAVEQAGNDLDDRRIEAPFAGMTGLSDIDVGESIDTDTVITTLDDLTTVEVAFSVPERYFGGVATGQGVVVRGAAYAAEAFEGEVSAIASRISDASRSFAIRAEIPNPDGQLANGMFMTVSLVLDERRSITVPEEAIISEGDTTYLFALDAEDTVRRREITIGARTGDNVEVVDGLEDDIEVVTSGYDELQAGDAVRLRGEPER